MRTRNPWGWSAACVVGEAKVAAEVVISEALFSSDGKALPLEDIQRCFCLSHVEQALTSAFRTWCGQRAVLSLAIHLSSVAIGTRRCTSWRCAVLPLPYLSR